MANLPTAFGSCWGFTILAVISQAYGPFALTANGQVPPAFPNQPPNFANPANTAPNGMAPQADSFQPPVPVTTFVDPRTGQLYGRFVETETVTVPKYEYEPVKVRNLAPRWVTEDRQTTQAQYTPTYTWQLQPRTVSSWNPFAPPQQTWEYVPIVQYQPSYVPVTRPITYQKYDEVEVTMMVPKLVNVSERLPKYVDKPLTNPPTGGTAMTNAAFPANVPAFPNAPAAQPNQVVSNLPTRPIDGPYYRNAGFATNYGYPRSPSYVAVAPQPYYAQQPQAAGNAIASYTPPTTNPATTIPMVAVNNYSNPYYPNLAAQQQRWTGYPNYLPPPNQYTQPQPYNTMASRPLFQWPLLATTSGPLFRGGLFSNNSNPTFASNTTPVYPTNYVASSTPMTSNYSSYPNNAGWYSGASNSLSFRPNSLNSPYPAQSWGNANPNAFRDPMQVGMPATVMR